MSLTSAIPAVRWPAQPKTRLDPPVLRWPATARRDSPQVQRFPASPAPVRPQPPRPAAPPLRWPGAQRVGGGAATAEPEAVQGLLLGGLALGGLALAYGSYRYYRHRRRENTVTSIRNEQRGQPVTEVDYLENAELDTPSEVVADDPTLAQNERTYTIRINPRNPVGLDRTDRRLLRIAELHERTHISADLSYSANRQRARLYLEHGDPTDEEEFGQIQYQQNLRIDARLQRLERIIKGDNALSRLQKKEMLKRVEYAARPVEYDPVINELLAYSREYGIRANSATVKALVLLARENLARRRIGGPNLQGNWPA
jgi:hypothetical protein